MWRNWNPYVFADGNVKWYSCCTDNMAIPQKIKHKMIMTQQFYFWICTPKNWKQGLEQIFVYQCTQQHCSQVKTWEQSKCPLTDGLKKMWYTHTQRDIIKERNSDTYDNMDNPWKHYAKWKVRHRRTNVMNNLKQSNQRNKK